jgi:hypothetical protein
MWTALAAVVAASASALPVRGKLPLAILAVLLLAVVGLSRLRSARLGPKPTSSFDPVDRAERIREARRSRYR